ncbi:MAG: zinc ABC transporter substrate-binding protein [Pseudacidovorax sp.]|uniref:metal ABC transporter solute-binding protein, Zn/Mn family n=1 Tax=Pseudacidovorax sp. TaxID=1934311 RepID=UPI001B5142FA|nr:zinc ABC transporter substrate-binding protein [Pseudacidovorax sp.]MBP6893016.1 zinc ABC transporter substrate-binding protein [Pseudacidovorax sp.]
MPSLLISRRPFLIGLLAVAAGASSAVHAQEKPLQVVASFSILADMVRQVGGPDVQVQALVGPNADAHVFQPTPADARALAAADLVVVNGLGFEGWIDRLVKTSGYRGSVVVASAGVTPRKADDDEAEHGHDHGHGEGTDPHAWQDLRNAVRYVANIRDALAQLRPAHAAAIGERAAAYTAKLQALDREVRARFAAIPAQRRRILTSHDAFGYFGAAYGVTLLSPQGINTDAEPSAAGVAQLIRQIRKGQVSAVFMENISSPRLVERIARESGVAVGGKLYSDALSAPGTEAASYLQLFRFNADAIATALTARAR